tara:strand:- start:145 stop:534 length:390 start_codon:yes stop_codon:yes gene_type:complete
MEYNFQNGIVLGIFICIIVYIIYKFLYKITVQNKFVTPFEIPFDIINNGKIDLSNIPASAIHTKAIHVYNDEEGKQKWEVKTTQDGKITTTSGDGLPPKEAYSELKPIMHMLKDFIPIQNQHKQIENKS